MAVKNYPPEMLAVWSKAMQEPLEIDFGEKKTAIAFRHKMHRLRKDMQKENHPLTPVADRIELRLVEGKIIADKQSDRFVQALAAAGVTTVTEDELTEAAIEFDEQQETSGVEQTEMQKALADLMGGDGG